MKFKNSTFAISYPQAGDYSGVGARYCTSDCPKINPLASGVILSAVGIDTPVRTHAVTSIAKISSTLIPVYVACYIVIGIS